MSLLTVVQDVCAVVGVTIPASVFSSITANRTMQEMLALANEMAERIASDTRAWTRLKAICTFTGDGVTTAFNLPSDYRRMLLTSNVWSTITTQSPMRFIPDTDQWLHRRMSNSVDGSGEWTIIGGQMHIFPAMQIGAAAAFVYVNRNIINLKSGGVGERFVDDADGYVLSERLLKLGMIWQWKANKGSPYAEDMGTYGDAFVIEMGSDSPAPILAHTPRRAGRFHGNL